MANKSQLNDPVGVGIRFPITFENGGLAYTSRTRVQVSADDGLSDDETPGTISALAPTSDDQKTVIRQALRRRLLTRAGSRFMRGDFGSRVDLSLFEINDVATHGVVLFYAELSLSAEERIAILKSEMAADSEDDSIMLGLVTYRIKGTEITDTNVLFERQVGDS